MSTLNATTLASAEETGPQPACFHCGLRVVSPGEFQFGSKDDLREFCCGGCLAVSELIHAGGLERYYTLRDAPGNRLDPWDNEQFLAYDDPRLQQGWLTRQDDLATAEFLVEGIACAACVWLIEHRLAQIVGVKSVYVNFSTHRLEVSWDLCRTPVSDLMMAVRQIGYGILPYTREVGRSRQEALQRALLKRLGLAGALGMQVMVISVALYAGDWFGIEPALEQFLRRVNLLLTIPIIGYAAHPFFRGAWRGICTRSPGMDLPVSLGILLAFMGSLWATLGGRGEIYFDSIAMFVFFLLGARYLELSTRLKGSRAMDSLAAVVPQTARRQRKDRTYETVPIVETKPGEHLLIRAGEVVPTDGVIVVGDSLFDESILTGEDRPAERRVGDSVISGSMNLSQPVTMAITTLPGATVLDSILRLAERSHADKPYISRLAEQVSRWFVCGVLLLALCTAIWGLWWGHPDWMSTTIAVLVVTCPCALSLATPLALHAATGSLTTYGVHIIHRHALETLRRVNHVVFDKTGTLTRGEMILDRVITPDTVDATQMIRIAAALEQGTNHPLARPLLEAAGKDPLPQMTDFVTVPGRGLSGCVDGKYYRLGSAAFVQEVHRHCPIDDPMETARHTVVMLGDKSTVLATFWFLDHHRPGATDLVRQLQNEGIKLSILSGDRARTVVHLAQELGIDEAHGGCLPEEKLATLDQWIEAGDVVAMVGDGINDAPALSRAHLGIAITRHVNLAAANADLAVSADSLGVINVTRHLANRTFRIIHQNIIWALTYNILAVPAALAGMVPPWLAGIGMSLSSVVVVVNAARLSNR